MEVQGLTQLSLKQLAELDEGRIATAFDQAVRRAAADCDDRPGDDRPRKITVEIAFSPILSEDGMCDSVKSQVQIKDTLPTRKSRLYDFGLRKGGLFAHVATNAESFVGMVEQLKVDGTIVFVGTTSVIAILDGSDRDDRVVLDIPPSDGVKAFLSLANPQSQKQVIKFLREDLYGAADEKLLAVIRRLDFSRNNDGRANIQHGRESLGRSVEASVQSAEGDIPEVVLLHMRAHDVVDLVADIDFRAAVSVDPAEEKIAIRSIGGEFDKAIRENRQRIVEQFRAKFTDGDVLVVAGKP